MLPPFECGSKAAAFAAEILPANSLRSLLALSRVEGCSSAVFSVLFLSYPHNRSKIASAASFAFGAKSPDGPTHEGHPASQGQA